MKKTDKKNVLDVYKLSPTQLGLMIASLKEDDQNLYFNQNVFEIKGKLDLDKWKKSWKYIIEHYSNLKASFVWKDSKYPLQIIHKNLDFPWSILNCNEKEDINQILTIVPNTNE